MEAYRGNRHGLDLYRWYNQNSGEEQRKAMSHLQHAILTRGMHWSCITKQGLLVPRCMSCHVKIHYRILPKVGHESRLKRELS